MLPCVLSIAETISTNFTEKNMTTTDLKPEEYAPFYAGYIARVGEMELMPALEHSRKELLAYLTEVPDDRINHAYAPGKWTIRECLQHIIDTERVFAYRALRLGRGDETPLPGFDQDQFASVVDVSQRDFKEMVEEFRLLRLTTEQLFKGFTPEDLLRMGHVSGGSVSVRAVGFMLSGHVLHHAKLYWEAYG